MRLPRWFYTLALLVAATTALVSVPAAAALIAYEGFDYPVTADVPDRNGGSGWAGAWKSDNPLSFIITPGLDFDGLGVTGGAANSAPAPDPPSGADITFETRQLASPLGADGTTVYLSFLLRSQRGVGFYGGLNLDGLFIGQSGGVDTYGLETAGGNIHSSVVAAFRTTALLVLRAQFQAGNDVFDLFVNPLPGGAQPAVADATLGNFDMGIADFVAINNAGAWTVDEIRVGSTFVDVTPLAAVPSPPVLWLVATGLILAGFVRLRQG